MSLKEQDSGGLKRTLTFFELIMASIAGIFGSGWLFGAFYAAKDAGPSSIFAWVIGAVAIGLMALVFAELGGMIPDAGGVARYPQYSHGRFMSFVVSWAAYIGYAATPPIESDAVMQYATHWVPGLYNGTTGVLTGEGLLVAFLLMLVFFIINYQGVKLFASLSSKLTAIKFAVPILTIIVLAFHFHGANFGKTSFAPDGFTGVMTAVANAGVIFALLGFRQSLDLAGESANPGRDIPRAVLWSVGVSAVIVILLQIVFLGGVPTRLLAHGWAGLSFSSPFADLALALNIGWMAIILFGDAVLSPGVNVLVYNATSARVLYAMERNGYMPKWVGKIHPKSQVPYVALFLSFIIGLIFLLPFPSWSKLVGIVSSAVVLSYLAGPVSAVVLRRTGQHLHRPITIKGLKVIAPVAFVIGSLIVYWSGWPTNGYLMALSLIGMILFFAGTRARRAESHWQSGLWFLIYQAILTALSYLGSKSFGGHNVIPYPFDVLVVIVVAIVFYFVGVSRGRITDEVSVGTAEESAS